MNDPFETYQCTLPYPFVNQWVHITALANTANFSNSFPLYLLTNWLNGIQVDCNGTYRTINFLDA